MGNYFKKSFKIMHPKTFYIGIISQIKLLIHEIASIKNIMDEIQENNYNFDNQELNSEEEIIENENFETNELNKDVLQHDTNNITSDCYSNNDNHLFNKYQFIYNQKDSLISRNHNNLDSNYQNKSSVDI